jgi:hypothetical protein
MTRAVQLSAESVEHYGPDYLAPMIRDVFGGPIDLDPASCPQANQLIGATWYYSNRGLEKRWFGSMYVNPPGGRIRYPTKFHNQAAVWYATLAHRFAQGQVAQAVFMVFNLELIRYAQGWKVRQPFEFPYCAPKERIDFWKPGPQGRPVPQGAPGHPNAIIYMGPNVDRFAEVFRAARPGTDWAGGYCYNIPPF